MKENKYSKSLAKNQVCAIVRMRDIRKNVLPKYGRQRTTETFVFEFSYLCMNSSLEELINIILPQIRESGTFLLVESGILLTIGTQNPSSTDKYWNPVPGIRNPQRGVQNLRLS